LCGMVIHTSGEKRKFVKFKVQQAVRPMEQLCTDIKYVYIQGEKRNALLLTILDVYSRSILAQVLRGGTSEKNRSSGCYTGCCSNTRPRALL
jgi:hypothetical protein